jgi:hypothetical protein
MLVTGTAINNHQPDHRQFITAPRGPFNRLQEQISSFGSGFQLSM